MKYSKILLCFGALWASSAFPAPAPCDTLRVAFLTDIHVTPGNVQDSLFRVAVDEINASPCDIVIFGGDLTNLGSDAELEYVHGLISRLEKPWHAVPGNHETTWSESACTTFARIFGHDGRTAFRAGDYLFLGYASGPFMKMAMGAVRTEDLAWLAAEAAKARPGQRIVSLCHYPLNNDLTNRTEVTATLRRLDIPLTLFGHYHRAPSLFNFDSIAGIQGRALRGKSDSDAGYTLLDFWGDSVRVREKTLGAEPRTRFTIRMQDDPQTLALASDPTPPVPDYKAHAQLVLQDSATIYTGAAFYKDLVYYGTTQGVLRAYDTRRNREVWRQRFGGALYTTPLVAEGLVIAGTTTDGLRAYDARTGRERWHIDTPTPIVGQGLVAGRGPNAVLYIGLGNGTMAKIAVSDGRILWRYDYGRGQSQGQPALADGKLVFGAWNGHLHCLDAATGKLCWKWTNGSKSLFLSPGNIVPRIAGGRVFIDAPDRAVTCLDLASGSVVWRCTDYKAREASGMSADGNRFYVKTMDGELLAVATDADRYTDHPRELRLRLHGLPGDRERRHSLPRRPLGQRRRRARGRHAAVVRQVLQLGGELHHRGSRRLAVGDFRRREDLLHPSARTRRAQKENPVIRRITGFFSQLLCFQWRWRESNPRPNREPESFLHA